LSDETKAFSREGFNEALFLAGIADRIPRDIQARRQRRIGHDTAAPNGVDEIAFGDDTFPVADQIIEQIEYLRRDSDDLPRAMQFAPIGVERTVLEEIVHATNPWAAFARKRVLAVQRVSHW
jgi:hypothetical protein